MKESSNDMVRVVDTYTTLMRQRRCWQQADAQSGGLLEWAMWEMGIVADERACDDERDESQQDSLQEVSSALPGARQMTHGTHAHSRGVPRQRLTRYEAVAIYLAKLGPGPSKAGLLAEEFGITAKAVRDVWTGRTWQAATMPVQAQQQHNGFLPAGAISAGSVAAAARVVRALCPGTKR